MKTWKKAVKVYYRFNNMGKNDFTYRKYFDPILEDKDINTISKQDIAKINFSKNKTEHRLAKKSFVENFLQSVRQKMYSGRK